MPAQLAADLALLTAHRSDLVADRVRMSNRLRDVLTGVFPALERASDYSSHKGALVLLTGCKTPVAIRRSGWSRLTAWLANRGVRGADAVAATALEAAQAQQTALPGEDVAAQIVAGLTEQILALDDRLKRIDKQISEMFRTHPQAEIIESLPGMGPILGAEFIVAAGDLAAYADAGHLASAAGLVPVPRDSGRRTGNLHLPKRYTAACGGCSTPRGGATSRPGVDHVACVACPPGAVSRPNELRGRRSASPVSGVLENRQWISFRVPGPPGDSPSDGFEDGCGSAQPACGGQCVREKIEIGHGRCVGEERRTGPGVLGPVQEPRRLCAVPLVTRQECLRSAARLRGVVPHEVDFELDSCAGGVRRHAREK